jgi:hypothetical protein
MTLNKSDFMEGEFTGSGRKKERKKEKFLVSRVETGGGTNYVRV